VTNDTATPEDQAMSDLYRPLAQPQPLRLQVHNALEQLIIDGRLQPGARLIETELAERLGVSRGPIREALQMLSREGWVELRPRQGTYVAKPSLSEIVDYFDVRALLEVEVARLAARSIANGPSSTARELLDELNDVVKQSSGYWDGIRSQKAEISEEDAEEAREFHRKGSQRFHHALAELAGNKALVDLLDRLTKRTRWYFSPRVLERTAGAWEEHDELCEAVAAGDEELAAHLMTRHMQATRSSYLKAYEDA
jgi:DNA-binding GntR family transcriptional regulator